MTNVKATLMLTFLLFGFFGLYNTNLPGTDNLLIHTNIKNTMDDDVNDLRLRAFVYDYGLVSTGNDFDLEDNSVQPRVLVIDERPEGIEPDYYPVRMTLLNDEVREVKHAWAWIE